MYTPAAENSITFELHSGGSQNSNTLNSLFPGNSENDWQWLKVDVFGNPLRDYESTVLASSRFLGIVGITATMKLHTRLSKAWAVLLVTLSAFAQIHEKRVTPVETAEAQGFSRAATVGVAVLVGVGKYPRYSGLSELRYPSIDVDTLATTLKKQRYLVLTLKDSDATRSSILNAIDQAGEALAGENLTAIFFFSGHGFAVRGENYLATLDASANDLANTGLSVKTVEQALTKTQAARRVMWIDACRDEAGKGVESRSFTNLQEAAGTRMLLSTKAGKVSYEDEELKQGLFSYYLVKGLQGDAAGPDGLVTFQDLSSYVTLQVRSRSLETGHVQVPYEAGEASGDFLIAEINPATSAPVSKLDKQEAPLPPKNTTSNEGEAADAIIFKNALLDLQTGRVDQAYPEFQQYLAQFPKGDLAANSRFYLGEIEYNRSNYVDAISCFNRVIEDYPGSAKVSDAHLIKAYAYMKSNQRKLAVQEFRLLVANYPGTPNAALARKTLSALGARDH